MAAYTADQVADTLIAMSREKNIEITNLKLQKLLYYAQAWSLVLRKEPLFEADFEAWVHGPVVPSVFRRFKGNRWNPIAEKVDPIQDRLILAHLEKVMKVYGGATAGQLERLSHSESPWKNARGALAPDVSSNNEITKESMREYYSERMNAAK
jgi:uncharacterized phage-associated protein